MTGDPMNHAKLRASMRQVLDSHVGLFNEGVRTHNFGPMVDHFSEDAEMYFEGIPVGPFKGRHAIQRAYSEQPPDDEIVILEAKEPNNNLIIGEYAWSKNPKARAGELRIETRGELIVKLTVRYER